YTQVNERIQKSWEGSLVSEARTRNRAPALRMFNPYPAYKKSGLDELDDVPALWEIRKSTWLFKIGSGTTPSDDPIYYGGEIPWTTTSELRETIITSTEKSFTDKALRDFPSLKIHPKGSLALAMYGATI